MKDKVIREAEEVLQGAREVKAQEPYSPERRKFLVVLMFAVGSFGAAIIGLPVLGLLLQPLLQPPAEVWRAVGAEGDFKEGQTVKVTFRNAYDHPWGGVSELEAAFVRRVSATQFVAFSEYCQHLGCPVRWDASASLFYCPCHGGVYYANGQVAAGPPPRALQQYAVRIRNGRVEIRTGAIPFAY